MGNIEQCCAEMEAFALQKWSLTEALVRAFSGEAQDNMRSRAPGPDTGTLNDSIKSEETSLGVFNLEVKTTIEDNPNPETGESAAFYGDLWERGHWNRFLRASVPPLLYMEEGSRDAYLELLGKLEALW